MSNIKLAQKSDIPKGHMKVFVVNKKEILIANVDGKFFAVDNRCTHMGGNLSQGKLDGNIVTCPLHQSQFDVTSGSVVSPPKMLFSHPQIKPLKGYKLKLQKEDILIESSP